MKLGRMVGLVALLAAGAGCSQRPLEPSQGEDKGEGGLGGDGPVAGAGGDGRVDRGAGGSAPLAWVEVPGPSGFTNEAVTAAWPAGDGDVFFTTSGYHQGPGGTMPWASRVLRWTAAGGWYEELILSPTRSPARALSGTGPDDVWTAADGHIFHRDTGGWQMVADDEWSAQVADAPQPLAFVGIAAQAPGDVWFVAPKFLLHRTAGGWSSYVIHDPPEPRRATDTLFWFDRIWLAMGGDLWVSGKTDGMETSMDPVFVSRYADGPLSRGTPGLWSAPVTAVWPTSDGGFWFAQRGYQRAENGQAVLVPLRRYAGGTAIDGITQTGPQLNPLEVASLWGRADDDVWAAGAYQDSETPALFHYDGQRWTEVADAPRAGRYVLVTGDTGATQLVTEGPRFFRQPRR